MSKPSEMINSTEKLSIQHDKKSKNGSIGLKTYILLKPAVQLVYHPVLMIEHTITREITYQPLLHENSSSSNSCDAGLDCTGQGECQPNIENSDGDKMQQYLVNANRQKKVCARRRTRIKKNT